MSKPDIRKSWVYFKVVDTLENYQHPVAGDYFVIMKGDRNDSLKLKYRHFDQANDLNESAILNYCEIYLEEGWYWSIKDDRKGSSGKRFIRYMTTASGSGGTPDLMLTYIKELTKEGDPDQKDIHSDLNEITSKTSNGNVKSVSEYGLWLCEN
ncbi:hypothetical protein [Bowmanella denitrificans]|uniref:hypothetical protein n=1 Tax=Bowmanella denitrificans TaxID=366582 RepID=UPI000C9B6BBC|nr:hypothetical protein [Bowmanella denitrificans]